jgi:hypothetical protein
MASRKGVFVGAYVPNHLKESLRRRVAAEHRTLSQEITCILEEAVHGKGLPRGSIDRRNLSRRPGAARPIQSQVVAPVRLPLTTWTTECLKTPPRDLLGN